MARKRGGIGGMFIELGINLPSLKKSIADAGKEVEKGVRDINRKARITMQSAGDLGGGAPPARDLVQANLDKARRTIRNRQERAAIQREVQQQLRAEGLDPAMAGFKVPRAARIGAMAYVAGRAAGVIGSGVEAFRAANFTDPHLKAMSFSGQAQIASQDPTRRSLAGSQASLASAGMIKDTIEGIPVAGHFAKLAFAIIGVTQSMEKHKLIIEKVAEINQENVRTITAQRMERAVLAGDPVLQATETSREKLKELSQRYQDAAKAHGDASTFNKNMAVISMGRAVPIDMSPLTKARDDALANLERQKGIEAQKQEIQKRVFGAQMSGIRADTIGAGARTTAQREIFMGNSVSAFARETAAGMFGAEARRRETLAPLVGEERERTIARQRAERGLEAATIRNDMLGFVANMPTARAVGGFEAVGAGQLGAFRGDQIKDITQMMQQMLDALNKIAGEDGMDN